MQGHDALNPAQREAVTTLSGPLLVLAGAGSGKTRVITHRMAELIARGTPPERILSVTFTNKAAREMRERATALLGRSVSPRPVVCTFHALCVGILRSEIELLGYPRTFSIYDRAEQESLAREVLRVVRVPEKQLRPADLLDRVSRWKSAGAWPEAALEAASRDDEVLAATAYRKYQGLLKARGAVDFDDLLLLTDSLFRAHPEALSRQQRRFSHVQIDEYQDTNALQFALIEAVVRRHRNLCAVGDDDQAIYGWRGAQVRHILEFPRIFPGTKVIRLTDNYRSAAPIIDVANRLVRHNPQRHEKLLVPRRTGASCVNFREFPDEESEAEQVVREVNWLIKRQGLPPGDIAILFRTNEQPRLFETELRRARLPYVLVGGTSFFDRREIRDILAYLKVCLRPEDDAALLRILNVPPRGIGETTVEKLVRLAARRQTRVWQALAEAPAQPEMPASALAAIESFRALVSRYAGQFQERPGDFETVLADLLADIDYAAEIKRQYPEPARHEPRLAMVAELLAAAGQYARRAAPPSLQGFLDESSLADRGEETDKEEQLARRGVKLMTLHGAKGLEFPCVFLVGLEEGLLPHRKAVEQAESAICEERRLCYVGITRARDRLVVSRAQTRKKWGKRRVSLPSRFWFEMQEAPSPVGQAGERHASP